ncbi:4,5-dihydroxyphthalate decarboxylase [Blastococcus saxobsidens]|uniref:4,5-dihydroxyphthalate decarboxylase n=1 Tax=Blastococcus saxobsidens TaxID=138336 RepID=A0A4Q7Y2G5_9ACTN|nr:4,5-dihydroxyphthalate decarboxylase [Blastococcus saxobsidens]RZU31002.1 4,5-dihydroxyphthalate decarboxylase [Blastococcus saxobsidens]
MNDLDLTLAVGRYAITEGLLNGTVAPRGVRLRPFAMPSPERHWRMLRHQEFDVCELSLAGYSKVFAREPDKWAAIPVFPHRRFRHGYVFISARSAVHSPEELTGAAIGLRTWGTTAGLWMRGILQDEHGVDLRGVRWVTEHLESAGAPPSGYSIERMPDGGNLRTMLLDGELQAVIYPERIHGADIQPIFPDAAAAERAYARRTGLFPIMHLVAVRRELVAQHPWLANELVTAFEEAKRAALRLTANPRWLPLAWGEQALDEQGGIIGADPWRYGLEENLPELRTAMRYSYEQGLVDRAIEPADLFWPSTRDRPPTYAAAR